MSPQTILELFHHKAVKNVLIKNELSALVRFDLGLNAYLMPRGPTLFYSRTRSTFMPACVGGKLFLVSEICPRLQRRSSVDEQVAPLPGLIGKL